MVYGDSISAAYGIDREQGWVHLLANRLQRQRLDYSVVNASVSGETTGGGLTRLQKSLQIHQPDIVILELGGNDGLRGYPVDRIRKNLASMIEGILDSGADLLLVGMVLPPNYGHRYTRAFEALFHDLAQQFNIPLHPFLLEGTSTSASLLQRDGIHPTAEAQARLLDELWPQINRLIQTRRSVQ